MGFISFNEEAEQYLCAAVLRPGNAPAAVGAVGLLRRLIRILRGHFPGVTIRVRLDGGFASPAVLEFLDAQSKLEYVVAMAKNAVLKRIAAPGIDRARKLSESSGKTEHIYGEVDYAAGKWPHRRRVVIKAEVVRAPEKDPKDNPRFVITNMKQSPQWIYEQVYCQRGDIENRIKLRAGKAAGYDCLTKEETIKPCTPLHVAYEVGAARQQTVRSPRTMYPHSQEWHQNREETVYLPA
jgi:hypothetical protein